MSCAEIIPKLELMADDELTSEQTAQVLSHIDACTTCRDNWYEILALRQAIKDHATSFVPSPDFEERVIDSIRKEAWQSGNAPGKKPLFLYAAAALVLCGTLTYFCFSLLGQKPIATPVSTVVSQQPTRQPAPQTASNADKQRPPQTAHSLAEQTSAESVAESLDDAVGNFEQLLKTATLPGAGATSAKDFYGLSRKAGFTVKPMQLNGFKLTGASIVATAPGKASMVRLCYRRKNSHGQDSIVCYEAATGKLIAKGLAEHLIDGKKICCGEVEDKSVVFIPGQKGNANETLLVGNISKSDLMDLVLSSS